MDIITKVALLFTFSGICLLIYGTIIPILLIFGGVLVFFGGWFSGIGWIRKNVEKETMKIIREITEKQNKDKSK